MTAQLHPAVIYGSILVHAQLATCVGAGVDKDSPGQRSDLCLARPWCGVARCVQMRSIFRVKLASPCTNMALHPECPFELLLHEHLVTLSPARLLCISVSVVLRRSLLFRCTTIHGHVMPHIMPLPYSPRSFPDTLTAFALFHVPSCSRGGFFRSKRALRIDGWRRRRLLQDRLVRRWRRRACSPDTQAGVVSV